MAFGGRSYGDYRIGIPRACLLLISMHCLLEGDAHFHFRHVLGLTETAIELSRKEKMKLPAFDYDFPLPTKAETTSFNLSPGDLKHIPQIHRMLLCAIKSDNEKALQDGSNYTSKPSSYEESQSPPLHFTQCGL